MLQRARTRHRRPTRGVEHLLQPVATESITPVTRQRLEVVVIARDVERVGRADEAACRVGLVGQLRDRQVAIPLEPPVAWHGHEPLPVAPNRGDAGRLPADGAARVTPYPVEGRHAGVGERFARFGPRAGLIEPQAGQIRGATWLEPASAKGHRHVPHGVHVQHGAVTRVLEGHHNRRAILHAHGIAKGTERLLRATIAIRTVRRIEVVHVQVFAVDAEDREPPRGMLVVADGHTGNTRLPTADHVPPRCFQVYEIAERRHRNRTVWIVGDERLAARGARPADHPVVALQAVARRHLGGIPSARLRLAPGRGEFVGAKHGGVLRPAQVRQQLGITNGIHRARHDTVERQRHIARFVQVAPLHPLRPQNPHGAGDVGLRTRIVRECIVARYHHLGRPVPRFDAEGGKIRGHQRAIGAHPVHPRVHPVDERADDRLAPRMVVREFHVHVAAIAHETRRPVTCHPARPQRLGHRARGLPAPQLQLEQPIACRAVALRKKQIMLVLRFDVDDARAVPREGHRRLQPLGADRLSARSGRQQDEGRGKSSARTWREHAKQESWENERRAPVSRAWVRDRTRCRGRRRIRRRYRPPSGCREWRRRCDRPASSHCWRRRRLIA